MPLRTRAHQLEEESWKALSNALPSQWVLRKPQPDYGVDGEIEIFNKAGSSTGYMFLVQLKGTDEANLEKALTYYFSLDKLKYYRSLPLPVLLLRYHSPSKGLYFKWSREVDAYYARKKSKSIKVVFSKEAKWSDETPKLLIDYLKFFRRFSAPSIKLPIEFEFDFSTTEVFSVPVKKVEFIIREAAHSLSEIIAFSDKKPSRLPAPRIKITDDIIVIDFVGLKGCSFHIKEGYSKEEVKNNLPHDVFVGIAFVLNALGHHNIAAEIASKNILSSRFIKNEEFVLGITSCFALARRIDLALMLSEQILESGEDRFLSTIFALPAFRKAEMTDSEIESFKIMLLKAINKAKEIKDFVNAGVSHYNLGNRIRGRNWENDCEALHHYRMASKYDPTYKKRDYFWSEVAGILFHLNRFLCSERFYSKALELGGNNRCIALRADSLMFAGKYKDAYDLFKKYSNFCEKVEDEWALKLWVLGGLIKTLKTDCQTRHPKDAIENADTTNLSADLVEQKIFEALNLDGLCGLAWFNYGVHNCSNNQYKAGMVSFLIAALVQPNDIEAWSNTVMCIFHCPEYINLPASIVSVAYKKNGERFFASFVKQIEEQPKFPQRIKTKIINLYGEYVSSLEETKKEIPILRLVNPDGTYRVIDPNVKSIEEELEEQPFPEIPDLFFNKEKS